MEENNNNESKNANFNILGDWTVNTLHQPMANPSRKKENKPYLKRTHAVCDQPTQRLHEECDARTVPW